MYLNLTCFLNKHVVLFAAWLVRLLLCVLNKCSFFTLEHLFIVASLDRKWVCTSSLVPLELGLHMHVSFTTYILPVGTISQILLLCVYFPKPSLCLHMLYPIKTVYARCILSGDRKLDCTVYKRSTHTVYVIYIVHNYVA